LGLPRSYPFINEFRTAVRTFLATSPLPIPGLQPDPTTKKA